MAISVVRPIFRLLANKFVRLRLLNNDFPLLFSSENIQQPHNATTLVCKYFPSIVLLIALYLFSVCLIPPPTTTTDRTKPKANGLNDCRHYTSYCYRGECVGGGGGGSRIEKLWAEPSRTRSSPATPFASECCCCSWCVSDVGKLSPITIVPALQCRSVEANKKRKFLMRLKWKEFIFRIKLNLLKHFHLQPGK